MSRRPVFAFQIGHDFTSLRRSPQSQAPDSFRTACRCASMLRLRDDGGNAERALKRCILEEPDRGSTLAQEGLLLEHQYPSISIQATDHTEMPPYMEMLHCCKATTTEIWLTTIIILEDRNKTSAVSASRPRPQSQWQCMMPVSTPYEA